MVKGVLPEDAEAAVENVLDGLRNTEVNDKELQKVKNKTESMMAFEDMSLMNRANSLAYYELLGDAELMNTELEKYQAVTPVDIFDESSRIFSDKNSNTLYYLAQ